MGRCKGKIRYDTERDVKDFALKTEIEICIGATSHKKPYYYQCPDCGGWHVTKWDVYQGKRNRDICYI